MEAYDIANNQITGAAVIGPVGIDWQFSGVGNFSSNAGEIDLLLRNNKTGALEVYDIANNVLTSAKLIESMIALSLAPQFKDRAIREAH